MSNEPFDRDAAFAQLRQNLALAKFFEGRGDYDNRNAAVMVCVSGAWLLGMPSGYRIDPAEPEWPVAYIELPTGQVSWHLPQHTSPWDGHSTEEKWRRADAFVAEGYPDAQ